MSFELYMSLPNKEDATKVTLGRKGKDICQT